MSTPTRAAGFTRDENDVPRVKDYTHWIKEERLKEKRLEAEMSQKLEESAEETCGQAGGDVGDPRRAEEVTEAEACCGDETEGAGHEAVATMGLAAEGDRAKIQNEIWRGSESNDGR